MHDTDALLTELLQLRDRVNALIGSVSGDSEKSAKSPPPEIAERMAAKLCIRCGLLPAETRGLCSKDYQGVRRMLIAEKISDDEAVKQWLWLAEGQKGRKSKYSPDDLPNHPAANEAAKRTPKPPKKKP
jgi:hypothetical protein